MSHVMTFLSLAEVWVGLLGLAAFLALFWVLRGAPIGQAVPTEDDLESPKGGYRDRVIGAVTVGMLLILCGGYLAITKGLAWSIPAFGLGFATVLALTLMNERYRHGSPSLRRALSVSTAAVNLSLVGGTLIVLNVIAFRYGGQPIDMTREREHSLSSLTLNQLKSLTQPVRFTTFYGRGGTARQQKERVDLLLDLYRNANPAMVTLDHVDPFREQARYDELVKRAKDVELTQGGGVVVEYGKGDAADHAVVRTMDLFPGLGAARYDPDAAILKTEFRGEDALTSAIMRLRDGKRPIIVFTTGHGEPPLDGLDTGKPGLGFWKARLSSTGWDPIEINLMTSELPTGAAVVVVVAPTSPFKADELTRLRFFTDRKGPLLVLLDDPAPAALDGYLKEFNVEAPGGTISEPRFRWRDQPTQILVKPERSGGPIVEPLENQFLLLTQASPLRITPLKGMNPKILCNALLHTSRQATVGSENGPLNVALVATDAPEKGSTATLGPRLVIASSRYMANNSWVQQFPANLDFLMNSVNWLRGSTGSVGITPQTHDAMTLTADSVVRARLVLVPTVMASILIISSGVLTYIARRR
jgi:hypothetical protein